MTSLRSDQFIRVALVTAGLSATGGFVGGVCAAAAVTVIAGIEGGVGSLMSAPTLGLIGIAAGAGALTGTIGAPLLGWALLRRVPLGRAILMTAVGTVIGAVVGELLNPFNPYAHTVPGVIGGSLLGFVVSGVGLRITTRRLASDSVARTG